MAGKSLDLAELHGQWGATFREVNGAQTVAHYGDRSKEYRALREAAGLLDLSFRGRACLTGADRQAFLNGQITNAVPPPEDYRGTYAFLTDNKARIQSDLMVYSLPEEILLDFEPGLTEQITERLENYIVAEEVEIVDVGHLYGLLSIQGPSAEDVAKQIDWDLEIPQEHLGYRRAQDPSFGEIYLMSHPRTGSIGFDCFAPIESLNPLADRFVKALEQVKGRPCGYEALEMARIEAGIPRFGVDMDSTNLAPEAGVTSEAISYTKGCYIGQEVIARIRTYGQVTKSLKGILLPKKMSPLPERGAKLYNAKGKSVGYLTSCLDSPKMKRPIALGYVRKEHLKPGTELTLKQGDQEHTVQVADLPFEA